MSRQDAGYLDAAALAAEYADTLVLGTVRDVHGAVAARVRRLVAAGVEAAAPAAAPDGSTAGSAGEPARPPAGHRTHRGIPGVVYTGISAGLRGSAIGLRVASRRGLGPDLEVTRSGRFVRAAVNGLVGDRLREQGSALTFPAGIRVAGRDVVLDRNGVAAAYPRASEDLVVFVHGLSENESYWWRAARPRTEARRKRPDQRSYGDRLAGAAGWSPVYVRLNTGLPIAENGVALAGLLDRLHAAWPVPVRRVALVGHSMGGLVVRAGCAVRTGSRRPWTDLVTDVVTLGTPHLGAPLERVVDRGVRVLGALPESAPLGRILEHRSVGILDLRHGLAPDVQNLPHARYRLVGATLARSPRSLASATVGDYLVPFDSAMGRDRRGEELFPGATALHVPGADHFDLLNHDAVHAALRGWLADDPFASGPSDPPARSKASPGTY